MALTQADLDALDATIASGTLTDYVARFHRERAGG